MKSIIVKIIECYNSFINPATNKIEEVEGRIPQSDQRRFYKDFNEKIATTELLIENVGLNPYTFIQGWCIDFCWGDDSRFVSFKTEEELDEFMSLLDGQTISNDDFNELLRGLYYINTSADNEPYLLEGDYYIKLVRPD
jgi:hypothetical protein